MVSFEAIVGMGGSGGEGECGTSGGSDNTLDRTPLLHLVGLLDLESGALEGAPNLLECTSRPAPCLLGTRPGGGFCRGWQRMAPQEAN